MVYFIQCEDFNNYIKIGWTTNNPVKRLKNLQVGCPYPLKIIGIMECDRHVERSLHLIFEQCIVVNEWFSPSPELLMFIEDNTLSLPDYRLYHARQVVSSAVETTSIDRGSRETKRNIQNT